MGILRFIVIYVITVVISFPLMLFGSVWAAEWYLESKHTPAIDQTEIPRVSQNSVSKSRSRQGSTIVTDPITSVSVVADSSPPIAKPTMTKPAVKPTAKPKLYPVQPRKIRKAPTQRQLCSWGYTGHCYPVDSNSLNWRATPVMNSDGTYPK